MKLLFIVPVFFSFMAAGLAQIDAMAEKRPGKKANCCTIVIDHVGPKGDLVSTVWEPLPTVERNRKLPMDIEILTDDKKQNVPTGWDVCSLKHCTSITQVNDDKLIPRKDRRQVNKKRYDANTPVIDLAGLANGSYIIRATVGNETFETKVDVRGADLARPEPKPVAPTKVK